jgi:RecB family exonuclease
VEALGNEAIHHKSDTSQLSLLDWKAPPQTPRTSGPVTVDYLSYSQIQTFIDCPLHYKAKYILKLPSPPSAASSFGNCIHQTLNEFYRLIKEGQKPDILEVFTRNWSPEGYESSAHARLYFQRGEKYLKEYLAVSFNPAVLPVKLEHPFLVPLNGLKIGGKIDRIDRTSDGKIEIIDYKTSTKFLTPKEADADLQLSFYALAATTLREPPFPIAPENLIMSLYYFEEQKKVSTTRTSEQLYRAKEQIYEYQKLISESDFKCSRSIICRHCDYATLCDFV